jgi:hypothetical protein
MQTVIHLFCKAGQSLRDRVGKDEHRLAKFGLYVESQKSLTRRGGWTKVKSHDRSRDGAINVEWDGDARVMVCRVVTRGGDPASIVGDFVDYLLSYHFSRIRMLTLVPEAGR